MWKKHCVISIFSINSDGFYIPSGTWDIEFSREIWEDSFLRALAHTPNSLCRTQTRTLCSPSLQQLGDLCVRVSVLWIIPCNISPSNQWHSDYADRKTRASVNSRENREVREARIHLVHVCLLFRVMCVTICLFMRVLLYVGLKAWEWSTMGVCTCDYVSKVCLISLMICC